MAIAVVGRDGAGRAERIVLDGGAVAPQQSVVVRGDEFREVLGARVRRPVAAQHAVRGRSGDARRFMFSGSGFGHGVGLCQAGALARLTAGATPADVLRYYYPGTVSSGIA